MSQLKWDSTVPASMLNWRDQIESGSSPTSEKLQESFQLQKLPTPAGFQDKEPPHFIAPSISLSQTSDISMNILQFTESHLADIEKAFEKDGDAHGAMNKETFGRTIRKLFSNVSDEMLDVLFLKVDSDCEGFVTWPKYVDYLLREFWGKEKLRKSQYHLKFHLPMVIIPLNHGCEVIKVLFLIQRFKKIGCFLTVTKDGLLQLWTETFSLINSFKLNQVQQPHHQQMWVTDMVCLHNMNLIAVASTEMKIEFFAISNYKCIRAFTFIDLDCCVQVMDYWSDNHRGVFCCGDAKGTVIIFTSENVASGLFNPNIFPRTSKWDHWTSVSIQKLLHEKSSSYRIYQLKAIHPNWCQKVKFIPQLNLVVSCSAIDKSSLVLTILPAKELEKPKLSVLSLRKGVLCFDYCPDRNFLATGGYDPHIRLWNPLVSKRPVGLMKGHQTAVIHLLVNSENSSILISISMDKNIRVWDLQDYVCLQSLGGKMFSLGNCPITSACFHKDSTLVCSTYSIGILKGHLEAQEPVKTGKLSTHSVDVRVILYSKLFKQVVSGSLNGSVSVWDIKTGKKKMEFSVSQNQSMELTAMALDESERCLLTGLRDGTMNMWNYNTGECLMAFPYLDQMEISGIIHMNKAYYVTGWSKRITHFMFHKTKPLLLCYHWKTFHSEDVLSMAKYQNQFFGTSSYNGDILFWNVSMLKPILSFNASKSPWPLPPRKVRDAEVCIGKGTGPGRDCEDEKWAQKAPRNDPDSNSKTAANANMRQKLMSAPPVMKHQRQRESDELHKKSPDMDSTRRSRKFIGEQKFIKEAERKKEDFWRNILLQSNVSVEKIIFLQTRPRVPHMAAMLSSCIDGYIYAWSIHVNGGLLGKFPVDPDDIGGAVVGAMATDEHDWILITGDCKGTIKIWDIKDYCTFVGQRPPHASGMTIATETLNKFQALIPQHLQSNIPHYLPQQKNQVVDGRTISLVPPRLLITWTGHLENVADILYVDNFQLIISAGQDGDVKAWKLSGDAVGTFGLSIWERLQDAIMDDDDEQKTGIEEKTDFISTTLKTSLLDFHQELANALVYQRREQEALMALLKGKADKEAEAWARLQKMAVMSPWAGDHCPEDIEESWNKWETQDRQVSKVVGAAYKPKNYVRNPKLLTTRLRYGCMKHKISPQIYQNLHFSDLKPIQQPDFLIHKVLDQQSRHIQWDISDLQRDLEHIQEQIFVDVSVSTPGATTSSSPSLSLTASASRVLDSLKPPSSVSLLQPWSASSAQFNLSSPTHPQSPSHRALRAPAPLFLPSSCSIGLRESPSCPL